MLDVYSVTYFLGFPDDLGSIAQCIRLGMSMISQ